VNLNEHDVTARDGSRCAVYAPGAIVVSRAASRLPVASLNAPTRSVAALSSLVLFQSSFPTTSRPVGSNISSLDSPGRSPTPNPAGPARLRAPDRLGAEPATTKPANHGATRVGGMTRRRDEHVHQPASRTGAAAVVVVVGTRAQRKNLHTAIVVVCDVSALRRPVDRDAERQPDWPVSCRRTPRASDVPAAENFSIRYSRYRPPVLGFARNGYIDVAGGIVREPRRDQMRLGGDAHSDCERSRRWREAFQPALKPSATQTLPESVEGDSVGRIELPGERATTPHAAKHSAFQTPGAL